MPLDERQLVVLREAALRNGVDEAALIRAAEGGTDGDDGPVRPTAERLLIGFLPFIKVRELRELWLGLEERVADDEMMCGDFALKHGGAPTDKTPEAEA